MITVANMPSGSFTAPISLPPVDRDINTGSVAFLFSHSRMLQRTAAASASFVLLVTNTAAHADIARPATDVCAAETISIAPKPVSPEIHAGSLSKGDQLITKVRELGMLDDGWHREDSLGAKSATVNDAEMFLRAQNWNKLTQPYISLSEDGEINLLWQSRDLYLDLGFVGSGTYTFFGKADDGEIFLGDDLPLHAELPERLQSLMSLATA